MNHVRERLQPRFAEAAQLNSPECLHKEECLGGRLYLNLLPEYPIQVETRQLIADICMSLNCQLPVRDTEKDLLHTRSKRKMSYNSNKLIIFTTVSGARSTRKAMLS